MLAKIMHHLMWRRRVAAAHAWRDYERDQHAAAVERLRQQAETLRGAPERTPHG